MKMDDFRFHQHEKMGIRPMTSLFIMMLLIIGTFRRERETRRLRQ